MSEDCPNRLESFEGDINCHLKNEFQKIIGNLCDNDIVKDPETCGSIVAYDMLRVVFGDLAEFDVHNPILGECEIQIVPHGVLSGGKCDKIFDSLPEELLDEWVGLKFPVRNDEAFYDGVFEIDSKDVLLSLFTQGKFGTAFWILDNVAISSPKLDKWKIDVCCTDGSKDVEQSQSPDYYLKKLPIKLLNYLDKKYSGIDSELPYDI